MGSTTASIVRKFEAVAADISSKSAVRPVVAIETSAVDFPAAKAVRASTHTWMLSRVAVRRKYTVAAREGGGGRE